MNKIILIVILAFITCSCSSSDDKNRQASISIPSINPQVELTEIQQSAFDALNSIQVNTDETNRFYSTYVHTTAFCDTDTTVQISQGEFQFLIEQFLAKQCQNLEPEKRARLAKSSVLAQEKYTVDICTGNRPETNYENGLPMSGTWLISNVLGRRDIIIVWSISEQKQIF